MLGEAIWVMGKFLNDNADAIQAVAAVVGGSAAGYGDGPYSRVGASMSRT